jgi:hypothetical protein
MFLAIFAAIGIVSIFPAVVALIVLFLSQFGDKE